MSVTFTCDTGDAMQRDQSDRASHDAMRLAVIGCGPRGLYCLERLEASLEEASDAARIAIDIFEPGDFPGAGNVYDPRQPHYLKMNFSAGNIDAWVRPSSDDRRLSLVDWLQAHRPDLRDPHAFVPRAVVGEYLHDAFQTVLADLRQRAQVQVHQLGVNSIGRRHGQWELQTTGGPSTTATPSHATVSYYDEVLLTVGHEGWRSPAESQGLAAFPVRRLDTETLPPDCHVAVRGFGLTWIDATLALTEGRGGGWELSGGDWKYVPCGSEPAKIVPWSRSGRPLFAKPDETHFPQPDGLEELWQASQARIDRLQRPIQLAALRKHIWTVIVEAAAEALRVVEAPRQVSAAEVSAWFDAWRHAEMTSDRVRQTMRASYRVATGLAAPDIAWALGATWRGVYSALATTLSHGGLADEAWTEFQSLAAEMERIAFGPPAENLGRMLALEDAGIVDFQWLTAKPSEIDGRSRLRCADGRTLPIDHSINAVIPSPLQLAEDGPMAKLVNAGTACRLHGRLGIRVDESGAAIDSKDRLVEGLSVLGRCTEGCVVGNDSLSRSLHDHPSNWAQRVARRVAN